LQLNASVRRTEAGRGAKLGSLGRAGIAVGILLVGLSLVFVAQVWGVVLEVSARPATEMRVSKFDLRFEFHDFFVVSGAFACLHAWVLWGGAVLVQLKGRMSRASVGLLGLGAVVLLCGHGLAWWLAGHGVGVGLGLYGRWN